MSELLYNSYAAYIRQLENCKGEQEISSFYLIAQSDAADKGK